MRHYSERPDGSIEYIDRKWFIERLVDKYCMTAVENNAHFYETVGDLAVAHGTRLRTLDDEQLAQEYVDRVGDPRLE